MPQVRVMGDDGEHVDRVVILLRALIAGTPSLVAGDLTRLPHRGGGGRIVFDVSAAEWPASLGDADEVRVERVETGPAQRPRAGRTPRALPARRPRGSHD
jgi:hypothetical protein